MKEFFDTIPVDGYEPSLGLQLAMIEDCTREWRSELGRVGVETIAWQPFPAGHSIGGIILHIADVEAFWVELVAAGKKLDPAEMKELMSEQINQYGVKWPVPPKKPIAYYFALHDRIRARTLETVRSLGNPCHPGKWRNTTFTLRWVLSHVLNHEAYHGGQAVLLKLMRSKTNR